MTIAKFSTKEALQFGWNTFRNNFGFLLSLFAGIGVIYFGIAALQDYADAYSPALSAIVAVFDWIFRLVISIGLIEIPLMFLDGKRPDYGHLISGYRHVISYAIASVLYMLIVVGGFILLVVPGIIWAMRFQFFGYLIIDKGLRPIESLKASWAMTKGQVWDLFSFAILLALINIAGAIALMIGLLITAPVCLIAMAFVYRKLLVKQSTQPDSLVAVA